MIKLISLNIERSKHLDAVGAFFAREQPDVVCLQELMEKDVAAISTALNANETLFTPMTDLAGHGIFGTGIFSRLKMEERGIEPYVRAENKKQDIADPSTFNNEDRAFSWIDVEKDGVTYRIGTTHFTWTPHGEPSEEQRVDMQALLSVLSSQNEFVLCGDFNAPRGGDIFRMLAEKYKDNIPPEYKTSIDVNLHRAGHLPAEKMDEKMVDGLFTTPNYKASDVRLEFGVSDHAAIVADVEMESA